MLGVSVVVAGEHMVDVVGMVDQGDCERGARAREEADDVAVSIRDLGQ